MAKKPFDIRTDYKSMGNKAMDAVASCILWHRDRQIALKAIYLKQPYYDWFRKGVEVLQGKPLEDGQMLTFDAVLIEKGETFQTKPILPETWTDRYGEVRP